MTMDLERNFLDLKSLWTTVQHYYSTARNSNDHRDFHVTTELLK